ncbi:MAG: hypothetical protein HC824_16745 [Synechococcales cyanobacterium RM1_1_8]|nr:hypothetical protein [Synechococcales cyanobacterium RM1_1_8]
MTMSATVRLAKQGDARAISQLINQQLNPRGITAKAPGAVAVSTSCWRRRKSFRPGKSWSPTFGNP